MVEIDRWIMARYASVAAKMIRAYDDYDYPSIYQAVNSFITVDISAFYVDVTKDRMYTFGATSEARRSGQTAMYLVADGLARLLAPVLPFTMDEVWLNLPGAREISVHVALFPRDVATWQDEDLLGRWDQLRAIRDEVNLQIEDARQRKVITSNLSAHVDLEAPPGLAQVLSPYRDFLPTLFGVSTVVLRVGAPASETGVSTVKVGVARAGGIKCERCWRFVAAVSDDEAFKGVCERCVGALGDRGVGSAS